jgi:hypothetical protein
VVWVPLQALQELILARYVQQDNLPTAVEAQAVKIAPPASILKVLVRPSVHHVEWGHSHKQRELLLAPVVTLVNILLQRVHRLVRVAREDFSNQNSDLLNA